MECEIDLDADGAEIPFNAFCKMPERNTIIGNDSAYDFEITSDSFYSEKTFQYDIPGKAAELDFGFHGSFLSKRDANFNWV